MSRCFLLTMCCTGAYTQPNPPSLQERVNSALETLSQQGWKLVSVFTANEAVFAVMEKP